MLLNSSSSNTFNALNCEVAYSCIELGGSSFGNHFNTMDVTNCDKRASVIIPKCRQLKEGGVTNTMEFLNIRGSRQGGGTPATFATNGTGLNPDCFTISNVIRP